LNNWDSKEGIFELTRDKEVGMNLDLKSKWTFLDVLRFYLSEYLMSKYYTITIDIQNIQYKKEGIN